MKQKTEWVKVSDPEHLSNWLWPDGRAGFWCFSDVRWVNFYNLRLDPLMGFIESHTGGKILGDQNETKD